MEDLKDHGEFVTLYSPTKLKKDSVAPRGTQHTTRLARFALYFNIS